MIPPSWKLACPSRSPQIQLDALLSLWPPPPYLCLPLAVKPQARSPLTLPRTFPWTCTKMVHRSHCINQVLHPLYPFSEFAPIASGYTDTRAQEITETITPIIIYLQDCVANSTLPTILHVLPYNAAASLHRMKIFFNNIQALKDQPKSMLIPDIKPANALFYQLPPLLPFGTILDTKLHKRLMDNLLTFLQSYTST